LYAGAGIAGTAVTSVNPNPYHIYPQGRTLNVYNGATGAVDGSAIVTTPVVGTFATGDTLEQPHYFRMKIEGLNFGFNNYQEGGEHFNFYFNSAGQFGSNDYEGYFVNNNDPTLYSSYPAVSLTGYIPGRGQLTTPYGMVLSGPHRDGLVMGLPPYGGNGNSGMGAVVVECGTSAQCAAWNTTYSMLNAQGWNAGLAAKAEDILGYNPVTQTWNLTAGATGGAGYAPACTYTFGPAGFVNSCAAGNNALTSYTTFLDGFGAYGNMLYDPQFQAGATYWTSYGGSTLTPNTTDYPDPWGGHTALKILTTGSTQYYQSSSSLAVGNTATSSVYACGAVGGESILFGPAHGTASSNATLPACSTGWGRFANTATIATTPTADFFLVDYTAGQTIYLAGAQTELQAQAGPYVRAAPISGDGFVSQGNVYPAPSSILTTASSLSPSTPPWLQYLSNGADGANTNAGGNMSGEYYYTNFTVPYGNTVTVNYSSGLIVHATGTCTIAGTIEANGATAGAGSGYPINSSGGGGSGGGASAGTAGQPFYLALSAGTSGNGLAGAVSGGNGTNGSSAVTGYKRTFLGQGGGQDGQYAYGGGGKQGANSGGAAGNGGAPVILMCASITGTDGTHTGTIDASGQAGGNAAANSTGAGSGGGGGVVILSSQSTVSTWPTINTSGGAGGTCGAFTTCGTGGSGGAGWSAEFQGW
jgi:hypothetical protein